MTAEHYSTRTGPSTYEPTALVGGAWVETELVEPVLGHVGSTSPTA